MLSCTLPCVDLSSLGTGKGLDGEFGNLLKEVVRLLKKAREASPGVQWILIENVPNILNRIGDSPPVIATIVNELLGVGFCTFAVRILASAGWGHATKRRRCFLLASVHGDARDPLLGQNPEMCLGGCIKIFGPNKRCSCCHFKWLAKIKKDGEDVDVVYIVDLDSAYSEPYEDITPTFTTRNSNLLALFEDGTQCCIDVEDAEALCGLPRGWTKNCYPVAGKGKNGSNGSIKDIDVDTLRRKRWYLIGNCVCVDIARWIGERLMNPYRYKYHGVGVNDRPMDDLFTSSIRGTGHLDDKKVNESAVEGLAATSGGSQSTVPSTFDDASVPNTWSFLCVDGLQDGVTFKYSSGEVKKTTDTSESVFGIDCDVSGSGESTQAELYQASIIARIEDNERIQHGTGDVQVPWDKQYFPRSFWHQKGVGTFAVGAYMSEAPVLTEFKPIGSSLTQRNRVPSDEKRFSFYNRKKERGWRFSDRVLARLNIAVDMRVISRLPGVFSDADMVGNVVWLADGLPGVPWPAEVVDPFRPAVGQHIPQQAINELTPAQRRASFPCIDGSYDPMREDTVNRLVFVVFLPLLRRGSPGSYWRWCRAADLVPWGSEDALRCENAANLAVSNSVAIGIEYLHNAIDDAATSVALVADVSGDALKVRHMKEVRAAAAVASVDLTLRCEKCTACISKNERLNCLVQRMKASTLSGVAGAQIAILKDMACGAKVDIWWQADKRYYTGVVCGYNPVTTAHTVAYTDGDVGEIVLYAHNERVQLLNSPRDWPGVAREMQGRLQAAREELAEQKNTSNNKRRRAEKIVASAVGREAFVGGSESTLEGDAHQFRKLVQFHRDSLNLMTDCTAGVGGAGQGLSTDVFIENTKLRQNNSPSGDIFVAVEDEIITID
jgi:hypothetical protein